MMTGGCTLMRRLFFTECDVERRELAGAQQEYIYCRMYSFEKRFYILIKDFKGCILLEKILLTLQISSSDIMTLLTASSFILLLFIQLQVTLLPIPARPLLKN